jgi:adenylate cyclase
VAVSEFRRSVCVPEVALESRVPARTQHYADSVARRLRVLTIATWIAAVVSVSFGVFQLALGGPVWRLGMLNLGCAVIFMLIPLLYRFGELVAPLVFFVFAYLSVSFICFSIGTVPGCSSIS